MVEGQQRRCIMPLPSLNDATKDPLNPLNLMFLQMGLMLVMSHVFYLILKPLGQSGPVAQIIAGMVLSPTLLSQSGALHSFYKATMSLAYFNFLVFLFRVCFMFLIGLETDFSFMKRSLRCALSIAVCSVVSCSLLMISFAWLFLKVLHIQSNQTDVILIDVIVVSNTASPVVYRMVSDLKLDTSDIGRLAVSTALLIELTLNIGYTLMYTFRSKHNFLDVFLLSSFTLAIIIANWYLVPWFGTWYPKEKHISKAQVLFFIVIILILSTLIESRELSSAVPIFMLGLMFPREGKTYRTMLQLLRFPVHEFILPVYFGYIGYRLTLPHSRNGAEEKDPEHGYAGQYLILGVIVALSLLGKILGVLFACRFAKIPNHHAIFMACILCMKGHFGLQLVDSYPELQQLPLKEVADTLLSAIVITTLFSGMLTSSFRRRKETSFVHTQTTIESHPIDTELRILSCVYSPRQTTAAISLISALTSSPQTPLTSLLTQIVELPKKKKPKDAHVEAEFRHDDDYGANDSKEINDTVDSFSKETKVLIQQYRIVSSLSNICQELCDAAEDFRVSIVFLPFHKHQRIDGKIKNDGEEIRTVNQKVLRQSPCSVGIFMDRNQTGFQQPHGSEIPQNVAMLFFGGEDDREALALSRWVAMHPQIHLTLIRFLRKSCLAHSQVTEASHRENEVLMSITNEDAENESDNTFLEEFRSRYVASGEVTYIEKEVEDRGETAGVVKEIGESYSLCIVGKGRAECPMTSGMNDWEECPEMGSVGDLLLCADLSITASVLVVQKHRHSLSDFTPH
ncbi:PREDICTED: cation/H(+) antiporter 1-like [Tarenaya hassleriana]|uniref:cation/H(+) antiporter 1-like n=1 Tax=Tarenaya hassleriana TaxID=28532 RepID=UPI00053C2896|nr:PREDICTED: cation/H(+) antiporter 1-like [Tarenaya hassleriana]